MAAKSKVNKSDVIRKILQDIGAVTKDAPEGWAKTVATKLQAKGIKVSTPMIYQLRTREMSKAGMGGKAKRGRKKSAAKVPAVRSGKADPASSPKHEGKYEALFAVKKLAHELGGMEHVESAIHVLKQLG